MGKFAIFVLIILVIVISAIILTYQENADKTYIQDWAVKNGYKVNFVERHFFDIGPFWYSKHTRIYRAELSNDKTFWFRFNLFSTDIEEYPK